MVVLSIYQSKIKSKKKKILHIIAIGTKKMFNDLQVDLCVVFLQTIILNINSNKYNNLCTNQIFIYGIFLLQLSSFILIL